jgi:AraC-like DNA-binding protein
MLLSWGAFKSGSRTDSIVCRHTLIQMKRSERRRRLLILINYSPAMIVVLDDVRIERRLELIPATRVSETGQEQATLVARDAARDQLAAPGAVRRQERQRARLQSFIGSRLYDPDLSVDCIARACNMSVRSVHRAFAFDDPGSVSKYIRMRRVCHCAADLRDPRQANRSITDICFSWGFNSTSHFSRLFKEQLGVTPRDYREAFEWSGEARRRMVSIGHKQAVRHEYLHSPM